MSIGPYHYHGIKDGYVGRDAFACSECGVTHYVELAFERGAAGRYLYQKSCSTFWEKRNASMPPGEPEVSLDTFAGFQNFVCPCCNAKGKVITSETLQDGLPNCGACGDKLEELGFWIT